MTNRDRLDALNNEEYAAMLHAVMSERDHYALGKIKEAGIDADLVEIPAASVISLIEWLESEVSQ